MQARISFGSWQGLKAKLTNIAISAPHGVDGTMLRDCDCGRRVLASLLRLMQILTLFLWPATNHSPGHDKRQMPNCFIKFINFD